MNNRRCLVWLGAAMMLVAACGGDVSASSDRIEIVVTTTVLGDIVENVVGSGASVEVLMPTGADPHDFQASAKQTASIHNADLVVANGLGFEEGLDAVLSSATEDGTRVLKIGSLVDPIPLESDPDSADPHVWLDPMRMVAAVDAILAELEQLDPSIDWARSGANYKQELTLLDGDLESLLAAVPIQSRKLVSNHDSLGYFANRYGLRVVGVVIPGGSTLADASSDALADLVDLIEDEQITAIFTETTQPSVLASAVAGEVSREVEIVDLYTGSLGLAGSGAESYVGMMRVNADRVARALSG